MIYGVGLGPGDPELMSVKAMRLISNARFIAYFHKAGRQGHARRIVEGLLPEGCTEFAMTYPMTTEKHFDDPQYRAALGTFYDLCCAKIAKAAQEGDVLILCEGDPFFYGSFMHLYERLKPDWDIDVIPAITGMSAAYTATAQPFTWGDDMMSVMLGTMDEAALTQAMQSADAIVVMKVGRNLAKIRRALKAAGKLGKAWIVEYATMRNETVTPLHQYHKEAPYFSIVLVHGEGRRP